MLIILLAFVCMNYSVFERVPLPLGGILRICHESEGGIKIMHPEDHQLAPKGLLSDDKR